MLVLERLKYPLSIVANGASLASVPESDFIAEAELVRRAASETSVAILSQLAMLPYELEPGVTEDPPQSEPARERNHCHAIAGPFPPPASICAR
jgi:hypothetical protein